MKALKSRIQSSVTDVSSTLSLSATEISEAEKLWIIESQILFAKDKNFDTWKKQTPDFVAQESLRDNSDCTKCPEACWP